VRVRLPVGWLQPDTGPPSTRPAPASAGSLSLLSARETLCVVVVLRLNLSFDYFPYFLQQPVLDRGDAAVLLQRCVVPTVGKRRCARTRGGSRAGHASSRDGLGGVRQQREDPAGNDFTSDERVSLMHRPLQQLVSSCPTATDRPAPREFTG
jgi:hypothetical protein